MQRLNAAVIWTRGPGADAPGLRRRDACGGAGRRSHQTGACGAGRERGNPAGGGLAVSVQRHRPLRGHGCPGRYLLPRVRGRILGAQGSPSSGHETQTSRVTVGAGENSGVGLHRPGLCRGARKGINGPWGPGPWCRPEALSRQKNATEHRQTWWPRTKWAAFPARQPPPKGGAADPPAWPSPGIRGRGATSDPGRARRLNTTGDLQWHPGALFPEGGRPPDRAGRGPGGHPGVQSRCPRRCFPSMDADAIGGNVNPGHPSGPRRSDHLRPQFSGGFAPIRDEPLGIGGADVRGPGRGTRASATW